jgi:acetyl-CoA carboxylase beta subunit
MDIFGNAGLEDDLGDAVTVAEVGEDHRTVVAAAVDPSHEKGALAGVIGAKLSAGVRAAEVAEKIEL